MSTPEFSDYQPQPVSLQGLETVRFRAVIGISSAGKSIIMAKALARNPDKLHLVLSTISRELRPGEIADVDLHSRTETEMRRRIDAGEYVTVAPRIFKAIYATAPEDYSPSGTSLLPVIPKAMPIFKALPFKELKQVYILPPSYDVWQGRLQASRMDAPDLAARIVEAKFSLEYAETEPDLQFVINDDLGAAVTEFERIVLRDEPPIVSQAAGRRVAQQMLADMG